jgi:DNA-binding transcriptional MerR regulator
MFSIGEFARLGQVSVRMLRHYDEIGVLLPARVNAVNGYREYSASQLPRLHRLVMLKDLGFALDDVGSMLDDGLGIDELRAMLRLRRNELRQRHAEDEQRIDHIEALLRQLDQEETMNQSDIIIKHIEPMRVAAIAAHATGFGAKRLRPAVGPALAELKQALDEHGIVAAGSLLLFYDGDPEVETLTAYAAAPIADQQFADSASVKVIELPAIEAATIVSRGAVSDTAACYALLAREVEAQGCVLDGHGRDVLIAIPTDDPEGRVVEMQLPMRHPA